MEVYNFSKILCSPYKHLLLIVSLLYLAKSGKDRAEKKCLIWDNLSPAILTKKTGDEHFRINYRNVITVPFPVVSRSGQDFQVENQAIPDWMTLLCKGCLRMTKYWIIHPTQQKEHFYTTFPTDPIKSIRHYILGYLWYAYACHSILS